MATPTVLQAFLFFFRNALSPYVGAEGKLAGLNLQKNIGRNAVAAAAIFYGISVFVSSAGIIYSTKESVLEWIDSYVRGDIIVTSGHPIASTGSQNIPMPVEMENDSGKRARASCRPIPSERSISITGTGASCSSCSTSRGEWSTAPSW